MTAQLSSGARVDVLAVMDKIARLPMHPCDDARNAAALDVAKHDIREARAAVAEVIADRDRLANIVRSHEAQIVRMTAEAAAVAELVEADKAYDAAKAGKIEADNRITTGDRSDDAFVRQADAHHAYDRAVDRRRAALARIGGEA